MGGGGSNSRADGLRIGGFGTLRKVNALYEVEEEAATGGKPQGLWYGPPPAITLRMGR